jgi:8-oxo-dGTP pyrophosphatase MutT (NUDIX family)
VINVLQKNKIHNLLTGRNKFLAKAVVAMKTETYTATYVKFALLSLLLLFTPISAKAVREDGISKIEVLVSTYCYRINRVKGPEILLLKRAPHRQLSPNVWECGGGSVRSNESFESAAKRQLIEETGLTATRWKAADCFSVEVSPGEIVPGIAFSCKANPESQVKIDPREHSDFRWVNINELEEVILVSQQMRKAIVKLLTIHDKLF